MTWTDFAVALLLAYLAYYGLNVLFDLLMSSRRPRAKLEPQELIFEEPSAPELISYEEDSPAEVMTPVLAGVFPAANGGILSGMIQSTGGISIAEMLIRAKDDLLEFTKGIPY